MARNENPPFERGQTFYGQSPAPAIDSANLGGIQLEGMIWVFEDLDWSVQGAKPYRTNRPVKCMVVRNVSGIALLPKRLANLKLGTNAETGGYGPAQCGQVDGYTTTTAARGYPIDEWLPAAGVPANDLFWLVIEGPATVLTDIATGAGSVFSRGDSVVALTAATSQATTAGRVAPQDVTGATALLAAQIQNFVGHALSAATTGQTSYSLLVDVGHW